MRLIGHRLFRSLIALIVLIFAGASTSFAAHAGMIDRVSFSQGPMVMVWDGDEPAASGGAVVLKGRTAVSTQTVAIAGGGLLDPVQANFSENALSAQSKSFKVASNAPFAIRAELISAREATGDFKLALASVGSNAQNPSASNAIEIPLAALRQPKIVYAAQRKTARRAGSALSQAVTFNAEWTMQTKADVVLTVFIP